MLDFGCSPANFPLLCVTVEAPPGQTTSPTSWLASPSEALTDRYTTLSKSLRKLKSFPPKTF